MGIKHAPEVHQQVKSTTLPRQKAAAAAPNPCRAHPWLLGCSCCAARPFLLGLLGCHHSTSTSVTTPGLQGAAPLREDAFLREEEHTEGLVGFRGETMSNLSFGLLGNDLRSPAKRVFLCRLAPKED